MDISTGDSKKMGRGPRARVCHVCGRQVLLAGFDFHVHQCTSLFEKREELKPKKERRKPPVAPVVLPGTTYDAKTLQELNELSASAWTSNLEECQWCARRFLPEKLLIHNRSCREDKPARKVAAASSTGSRDVIVLPSSSSSYKLSRQGPEQGQMVIDPATRPSSGHVPSSSFIPLEMQQCSDCGRTFNEVAYAKHIKICKKVFIQKRKAFDSARARAKGTELEQYQASQRKKVSTRGDIVKKSTKETSVSREGTSLKGCVENSGGASRWREDSLTFRRAIRAARAVTQAEDYARATGMSLRDVLPPPSHQDDDPVYNSYIQCPTCGRSYSTKAGERHIPQCKNIINKPTRLLSHSGQVTSSLSVPTSPSKKASPKVKMLSTMAHIGSSAGSSTPRFNTANLSATDACVLPKHQLISPRNMKGSHLSSGFTESKLSCPNYRSNFNHFGGGVTQGSTIVFEESSRKFSALGRKGTNAPLGDK